jgi:hypothetical protein
VTAGRVLGRYLAAGVLVAVPLALADGARGLRGGAAAWVLCGALLFVRPAARRVANRAAGPKIGGRWGPLHMSAMLFRLAWALGGGAVLYARIGDRLGVGFWIALIVFYQVMLALSVAGMFRRNVRGAPAGHPASDGDPSTHAPG